MLDLGDEFLRLAFLQNAQPAVLDADHQPAGGERADEHDGLRVLADVDEAAGAREPRPELRHVEVALAVGLREPEERDIEPAAVVEVELVGLVDDRLRVGRRAEVETARRNAADDAGLGGQRQQVDDPFLRRDARHALGHADAEIDDAVGPAARVRRGAR